jgi:hypothetical protein
LHVPGDFPGAISFGKALRDLSVVKFTHHSGLEILVRNSEQPRAAEKPVYARFDREKGQNVESYQKHYCEFDIGAKWVGQRFLIIPYFPQKDSAQNPERKNSAPADRFM